MRKIIQITTGMYSEYDERLEEENQFYVLLALCDDNTIWLFKHGVWTQIQTDAVTGKGMLKPPGVEA